MKDYLKRTAKNKIMAVIISTLALVPIWIDNDGTFFVFTLMFTIPLFFARKNYIL